MSKKRTAASRRTELRRRAEMQRSTGQTAWSDPIYGISVQVLRPGGGSERHQVRWTVPADPLTALASLESLRSGVLTGLEQEMVDECREYSIAWATIGAALGITGEAARLRHGARIAAEAVQTGSTSTTDSI